jgi:hypothetical protein
MRKHTEEQNDPLPSIEQRMRWISSMSNFVNNLGLRTLYDYVGHNVTLIMSDDVKRLGFLERSGFLA